MTDAILQPVIIVDDEAALLETEALTLEMNGYATVITCTTGREALAAIERYPDAVVVLDVTMPVMNGISVLEKIQEQFPEALVIMLTGLNDAMTAVTCMRKGAFDYMVKPIDQSRLLTSIGKAIAHKDILSENRRLQERMLDRTLLKPDAFAHIVTADESCLAVFRYIEAIAPTGLPVLITGETGTGKELFANAVHRAGDREGRFVAVNTAGVDDTLFSDTLFGHDAGAFTGALRERNGFVAQAENGTLFLDEIGDLRPESQVKLLRLLQEGTYYRLGSETELRCSARIVAATNRTLDELQQAGSFRKDLFYRLKAHHVHLPPLRERKDDLPLLLDHFLTGAAAMQRKGKPAVPPELMTILCNYDYPGNIREFQGMVYDAVGQHSGGILSCSTFKAAVGLTASEKDGKPEPVSCDGGSITFPTPLPSARTAEFALVHEAFTRCKGNRKLAAEMIGMTRQTFTNKLREMGIEQVSAGNG